MTQTRNRDTDQTPGRTTSVAAGQNGGGRSPQQRADAWLAGFESALRSRDVDAAAGMFATESYWRDLVSFTWNIHTVEGRDGVADLLRGTLEGTEPSGFATEEPPEEADGVLTAWLTFETAWGGVAACCGSRRRAARTARGRS